MAVEARRVDPFHTQMIANRDFIAMKNPSATRFYASQAEDFIPLSMTVMPDLTLRPSRRHQQPRIVPELFTARSTSNYNAAAAAAVSVPRDHHKRSRDAIGDDHLNGDRFPGNHNPHKMSKAAPFLGDEAAFEIQRQQSEIDRLISQHTQRLRSEVEVRVKQQSKALLSSIHESVARKLKEKDKEIQKIGKLNVLLQEKVNFLVMENQIWRGLAQDNEAASNALRSDLVHALTRGGGVDDAESCCGSNDPGREGADGGGIAEVGTVVQGVRGEGVGGGAAAVQAPVPVRGVWAQPPRLPGVRLGGHGERAPESVVVNVTVGSALGWKVKKEKN